MSDGEEAAKQSKASVNYRHAEGRKLCRNCRYSYSDGDERRCMKVKGVIRPDDVCDLWRGM